jgi:RNA polymerase sigma factor (sigma-70 family)
VIANWEDFPNFLYQGQLRANPSSLAYEYEMHTHPDAKLTADRPPPHVQGRLTLRAHAVGTKKSAEPRGLIAAVPPADDATLVARCLRGDQAAWAALVKRYQRLVYAIVRRTGRDEHMAADVFQTVFARLVQHLPRIADPARLQAWIVTTAKREALLQLQRGQRTVSITDAADSDAEEARQWDLIDDSPNAEQALNDLQQAHRVRLALDRLEPRQRDLMLMLFRDDDDKLSYDEIAARLGIPVGSIGPTRARCLEKLRRLM